MASRMASICETYQHSEQKWSQKFCRSKEDKNSETHPEKPEKGETGCVLGAGGDGNGWERVKPDGKTQCPNQNEPHSHATQAKRKPAKTQCFRRFLAGAEGLVSAAASVGSRQSATGARSPHDTHRRRACGRTLLPNPTAH